MGTHPIFESDFDCLTDWLFDWIEIMPKYYCDYCDTFLTHDSPSVRKTHNAGRKHKDNVRTYYQEWLEKQTQNILDKSSRPVPGMHPGMIHGVGGFGNAIAPTQGLAGRPMMMRPGMMPMMGNPMMMRGGMMMRPNMMMMRPGFQPY